MSDIQAELRASAEIASGKGAFERGGGHLCTSSPPGRLGESGPNVTCWRTAANATPLVPPAPNGDLAQNSRRPGPRGSLASPPKIGSGKRRWWALSGTAAAQIRRGFCPDGGEKRGYGNQWRSKDLQQLIAQEEVV